MLKNEIDITDYIYLNNEIKNRMDYDTITKTLYGYYWTRYLNKTGSTNCDYLDAEVIHFILGYYHKTHSVRGTGSFVKAIKKNKLFMKLYNND
jgi:hypothetical protein